LVGDKAAMAILSVKHCCLARNFPGGPRRVPGPKCGGVKLLPPPHPSTFSVHFSPFTQEDPGS